VWNDPYLFKSRHRQFFHPTINSRSLSRLPEAVLKNVRMWLSGWRTLQASWFACSPSGVTNRNITCIFQMRGALRAETKIGSVRSRVPRAIPGNTNLCGTASTSSTSPYHWAHIASWSKRTRSMELTPNKAAQLPWATVQRASHSRPLPISIPLWSSTVLNRTGHETRCSKGCTLGPAGSYLHFDGRVHSCAPFCIYGPNPQSSRLRMERTADRVLLDPH